MTSTDLKGILPESESTIAAIASASGRGAIAVVRISGSAAHEVARKLLRPMPTDARQLGRCTVHDVDGALLDDAIAWWFKGPHSYTGEDVVEISTHGGLVVPQAVLRAAIQAGARLAEPGEFTRRAVLNGKLDLIQAEAVADLIDARSSAAHRQGLRQLDGGLSQQLLRLREQLLVVESMLVYDIDFPEEDDGPIPRDRILASARDLQSALEQLIATGARGELIHDGALVVLAGAPNVGKSSLFNALLGEARAIVTSLAGTTRDAIEAVLDLPGYPLRLVDTAGLRDTGDPIELLGIETTARYLGQAAVVLACVEPETARETLQTLQRHTTAPVIVVGMKSDTTQGQYDTIPDAMVSATTRAGLHELLEHVEGVIKASHGTNAPDEFTLTRTRHRVLVGRAHIEVKDFIDVWMRDQLPAPVAATHVREAASALGELIGSIHVEDILDVVFRSFCVGK